MSHQVPVDDAARARENDSDHVHEIAPDLAYQRHAIVNVMYFGPGGAGDSGWVLVDAGVLGSGPLIRKTAAERFGEGARPAAIVMTHGHFDHVGALEDLAREWDVPVYAHELELPYLNGTKSYPPPDPTVGGGMMATMSKLYPRGPVDVSQWLRPLPADESVPGMEGWRWIHTPGHTEGHVSLWRETHRTLIAGDAFVTTDQESAYSVATQKLELHGPPQYFTPDWESARESVRKLHELGPELVVTGHGRAMSGPEMRNALQILARDFDEIAVPDHGKYVRSRESR